MATKLLTELHVKYIQSLGEVRMFSLTYSPSDEVWDDFTQKKDLMYHLTAHLRLNAVYWGLIALCVMKRKDALNRDDMIAYVLDCWDDEAGVYRAHVVPSSSHARSRWIRRPPRARCAHISDTQCNTDTRRSWCSRQS